MVRILLDFGAVVFFFDDGIPRIDAVTLSAAWKVPGPAASLFDVPRT
jgi:hypothetical protein